MVWPALSCASTVDAPEVRRDDDVVELEQRRLGGRLRGEHVDRGAGDATRRGSASASAASSMMPPRAGVDDPQRRLRVREQRRRRSARWCRASSAGGSSGSRLTRTSSSIDETSSHAELPGAVGAHVGVVRDEPHPERVAPAARPARRRGRGRRCRASCRAARRPPTRDRFQAPASRSASACGTLRACASSSAMVCSAADSTFDCGAFTTITPRRVAASTSTLSSPMPARPTTCRSRPRRAPRR